MRIKGLTICGQRGLDPTMTFTRFIPLLSYHHPSRMCWLWSLQLRRCISDEHRAFRWFRVRGHQDRRVCQFWAWSVEFTWQDEGRFLNPGHQRRSRLSHSFGIKFDEPDAVKAALTPPHT